MSRLTSSLLVALAVLAPVDLAHAQATNGNFLNERVLYGFQGGADGSDPAGRLVADSSGALYGITAYGASSQAQVFKLTPPAAGQTQWTLSVLHIFADVGDGGLPFSPLVIGPNGALYGAASGGGEVCVPILQLHCGTVFELTPPSPGQAQWNFTVLHTFTGGADGSVPTTGHIALDANGALYGATQEGGPDNMGTIYKLTPPAAGQSQWTEQILATVGSAGIGSITSGVIFGSDGALYGTTALTAFQLNPPSAGQTQWSFANLHTFGASNDGSVPIGDLVLGPNDALYGATEFGGASGTNFGTVFELAPPAPGSKEWTETILHSFANQPDGAEPNGSLVFDSSGALYGDARYGGVNGSTCIPAAPTLGCGMMFKLTPPSVGSTQWTETTLYNFLGNAAGGQPIGGLIWGPNGALYGVTPEDFPVNQLGTVFALTVPFQSLDATAPDFNSDGTSDILWRGAAGQMVIWEMAGGAVSAGVGGQNPGNFWTIDGTGDFFGAGFANSVLWRGADGSVVAWEMNAGAVGLSAALPNPGFGWTLVGTGDFYGTGHANSLLWRNVASGQLLIREMNGGSIVAAGMIDASLDWTIVGLGDFNGDGKTDILWRNLVSGQVLIWQMNGAAVAASGGWQTVPMAWTIEGVGDFFDTGHSNAILWRNSTTGAVAFWEMSGGTVTQSAGGPSVPAGWNVAGVGDYYGSGHSNCILWRNVSGKTAIWQMNGGAIVKSGGGASAAPETWALVQ